VAPTWGQVTPARLEAGHPVHRHESDNQSGPDPPARADVGAGGPKGVGQM